jgi:hypothetical protein
MNLKANLGLDACAFDHTGETGGAERRAAFRCDTNGDLSCSR